MYGNEIAIHDYAMADYVGIERLIEYGGNLFRLSLRIRQWLGSKSFEQNEVTGVPSLYPCQRRDSRLNRLPASKR